MVQAQNYIATALDSYPASKALQDLLPKFTTKLPKDTLFTDDLWNILEWKTRKGNSKYFYLDFSEFCNKELKTLVKIFLLHRRMTRQFGMNAAYNYVYSIKFLDEAIWRKPVMELVTGDFYRAEKKIIKSSGAPGRLCHFLFAFGEWLNLSIGIPISYAPTVTQPYKHGRKGPEKGRQKKLIHTLVIRDMVEANTREGLSDKDRFFLSAFVIMVATGFRINELATLPKNCLECRDNIYSIHFFPEKVPKLEVRFISQDMVPAVQSAIDHIISCTEPGREAVRNLRKAPGIDWTRVLEDPLAADYFVGLFAHEWTSNPRNLMINPDGVWMEKEKRVIDIISIVEQAGSKSAAARQLGVNRASIDGWVVAQQNARRGVLPCTIASRGRESRTNWDTDTRVISILRFIDHCGICFITEKREPFRHIIDEAQRLQLEGATYPRPNPSPDLEKKYTRTINPVVQSINGKPLLQPEDALFIIPRYSFSESRSTKEEDYRLITDKAISRWFSGEGRSSGTGNHEDSCFVRLVIIDPNTNDFVKFSSHDVRHWLDTTYAEGHMNEDTIALIFSRKKQANHTYDQTSKMKRLENIRQAIRDGKAMGHLSENYHRLAKFSRDDAEQYLLAGTRMVNTMPHGACTLSWGMEACPNHLSCFAGKGQGSGCCEHLQIDVNDEEQIEEIRRIDREIVATLDFMPEESPQYQHFSGIKLNISSLLAQTGKGVL